MRKKQTGPYGSKHGPDTRIDQRIAEAIGSKEAEREITCATACAVAADLGVSLQAVGTTIDLLDIQISKCQLGLFGFPPQGRIVKAAVTVVPEMETAIRSQLVLGRLPCERAWQIADALSLPRMDVAAACEALEIKVKPCQLGAF